MKVAVCGLWHVHAKDYLKAALREPTAEVVGVWDENPEWRKDFAEKNGLYEALDLGVVWLERALKD